MAMIFRSNGWQFKKTNFKSIKFNVNVCNTFTRLKINFSPWKALRYPNIGLMKQQQKTYLLLSSFMLKFIFSVCELSFILAEFEVYIQE